MKTESKKVETRKPREKADKVDWRQTAELRLMEIGALKNALHETMDLEAMRRTTLVKERDQLRTWTYFLAYQWGKVKAAVRHYFGK